MDSSSPYTIHRLQDIGSKVIITPDQMFTDYTKALMQLDLHIKKENINVIEFILNNIIVLSILYFFYKKYFFFAVKWYICNSRKFR